MSARYFLVTSRGHMATTWLTNAINALPETIAVHGGKPVPVNYAEPLSHQLRYLSEVRPVRRCGLVHSVNATNLFAAYARRDLTPDVAKSAHLCRNPIMLAESMAAVTSRDWTTDPKFKKWSVSMRHSVMTNRIQSAVVEWPESVRAAILSNNESVISRMLGIWNRTHLEATDILFYEGIQQILADRGNRVEERYPIFRFEDYTSNQSLFGKLLTHIAGETLTDNEVDGCFAMPAVNRHRNSAVTNPEAVYRSWSAAERDMFNVVLLVTGLKDFFERRRLYDLPLDWSAGVPQYSAPPTNALAGITLNAQAIL